MRILLINVPHPSIEMVPQCRPCAIRRGLVQRDERLRHAMRWYTQTGRPVWLYEILNFMRGRLLKRGPRSPRSGAPPAKLSGDLGIIY